jgi:hypothetical protein
MIARVSLIPVLLVLAASSARAQTDPPLYRLQLAAGIGFINGASLGDADANLRSGVGSDPYRVFASSSRLAGARVLDLRAAVDLTPRFGLEAHALYGHPELRTSVTADVESAPAVTVIERLDHYLIDGGIVFTLDELRVRGWQPFAAAGAGYLRQLHEGLTVTEEGRLFYVGGGARRVLVQRAHGLLRGLGARADVRLNVLSGGITVDDDARRHLSAGGSVFVIF